MPRFLSGWLPTKREALWLLAGIVIAVAWFSWNRSLPPLFRGEICCDSTSYMKIAAQLPAKTAAGATQTHGNQFFSLLKQVFSYAGYTPPGFPLFLGAHRYAVQFLHLDAVVSWLSVAFVTALLLHFCISFFFYRSLVRMGLKLHPVALFLLLIHPGLLSHAALPLADFLAVALMMAAIGCLCRAITPGHRGRIAFSLAGGIFLGLAVFTRTSHLIAASACAVAWLLFTLPQVRHGWKTLLLPLLCLAAFGLTLAPRIIACTRAAGTICYSLPKDSNPLKAALLQEGLYGARTYTVLAPNYAKLVTLSDPLFLRLTAQCPISTGNSVRDLLGCLAAHPLSAALYMTKKTIGLFDNFFLNSYATYVTPGWVIVWNRIFGVISFVGFFALLGQILIRWALRGWTLDHLAPFVYPLTYGSYSILLMIESRYGLPMAPFGIVGFVLLLQHLAKTWKTRPLSLVLPIAAAVLFLVQVLQWDSFATLTYRSIGEALNPASPKPVIVSPLRIVSEN